MQQFVANLRASAWSKFCVIMTGEGGRITENDLTPIKCDTLCVIAGVAVGALLQSLASLS